MITTSRRVILQHTAGPHPGLEQVVGNWTDAQPPLPYHPAILMWPDGRVGPAELVRQTERAIYYREVPMIALMVLPVAS